VLGFGVQAAGCRLQAAGCRLQGAGCRVQGAGVQGAGCRVQGAGCRVESCLIMARIRFDRPFSSKSNMFPAEISNPKSQVIDTMGAWMTARIPKGEKQPLEPFSNAPLEPLTKMSEGGSSPQGLKLKGFDTPKDTKELKMNNNLSGYNNKLSGYWNSAAELRSPGSPVPGGAHEVTPGNDSPKGLKDPGFPKELKASDSPPKGVEEGAVPNEVEGYVSEGGLLKGLAEPLSESDSPKELAR
jgi:hypothetical protein